MSLIDLLRMSSGNLKRRKLRTFLTVLGVVIGTASIVVMISLGLGMQKSMYKQVEESGGITNIDVTGKNNGGGGVIISSDMMHQDQESEKYITDERTGLKYELVGDYYLVVGDDEPEEDQPIGTWGQRHLRYLKKHRRVRYANLLTTGKLNDYLADLNEQAEAMFSQLVKLLAEKEGVTEVLKAENQMLWVQKMNNLRNAAMEIVLNELIYR